MKFLAHFIVGLPLFALCLVGGFIFAIGWTTWVAVLLCVELGEATVKHINQAVRERRKHEAEERAEREWIEREYLERLIKTSGDCPPCNGDCSSGRRCPARVREANRALH